MNISGNNNKVEEKHACEGCPKRGEEVRTTTADTSSTGNMAINGPIYFLIREQAKSMVSIQELKDRMKALEVNQDKVILAIRSVHCQLLYEKESTHLSCPPDIYVDSECTASGGNFFKSQKNIPLKHLSLSKPISKAFSLPEYFKYHHKDNPASSVLKCKNTMIARGQENEKNKVINLANTPSCRYEYNKSNESIKEDSGVDSDYRENGNDFFQVNGARSKLPAPEEKDELLILLDVIDQKSMLLTHLVKDLEKQQNGQSASSKPSALNLDFLLSENIQLQQQLSEMKSKNDQLNSQLEFFKSTMLSWTEEKKILEEKLEMALSEKQQLELRIHGQFKKSTNSKSDNLLNNDGNKSLARQANFDKSFKTNFLSQEHHSKVSSVLQETNVLELQRQLLTYIMENDVLHAKLQQNYHLKTAQWQKTEKSLKDAIKKLNREKEDLQIKSEETNLELTATQAKVRMLEGTLKATHYEQRLTNLSMENIFPLGLRQAKMLPVNKFLREIPDDSDLKSQSMPTVLNRVIKQRSISNSYIDEDCLTERSISQLCSQNSENTGEDTLVNLNNNSNLCSSVPSVQSNFWNVPTLPLRTPNNHSSFHRSHSEAALRDSSHSKEEWNSFPDQNDISSICSEFDPLLNDIQTTEKFADSLNQNAILKPTQLSSVGDSLHSGSLDHICGSPLPWQINSTPPTIPFYINNSSSNIHKDAKFLHSSSITNKSGPPHQVNILNCLSQHSELALL